MNHETTSNGSTIGSLLTNLRDETSTLLRQEVALAKAEINEKASRLGKNAVAMASGGAVASAGLIVLLMGLSQLLVVGLVNWGVSPNIAAWLGPVLIGATAGIIGLALVAKAKKAMTAEKLIPQETVRSLKDDKRWAETKIHQTT